MPTITEQYFMAMHDVQERFERATKALVDGQVPHAVVGGQAVGLWVTSRDTSAFRVTKDVDLLLDKDDLIDAKRAFRAIGMSYYELMGIGMFMEDDDPGPKHAVHLLWAQEQVRPYDPLPTPSVNDAVEIEPGKFVVPVRELVIMKLTAHRRHDQVHLLDMIGVGLVDRSMMDGLPHVLADRLDVLLTESGK